jgi:hypothetical protein
MNEGECELCARLGLGPGGLTSMVSRAHWLDHVARHGCFRRTFCGDCQFALTYEETHMCYNSISKLYGGMVCSARFPTTVPWLVFDFLEAAVRYLIS